jgi:translation initiation factor IF-3
MLIARFSQQEAPTRDGPRVNDAIESPRIRLIDANGEMVGIVSIHEGLQMAYEADLDLVEISPNADPPVCKLLDIGKYKYELQKKENEARKKQKVILLKEIKMRPGIDDHDYDVKLKAMRTFLDEGDKVKVTLRFRGREMVHSELGMRLLERVKAAVDEKAKVEQTPKMEGRQMTMVLAPK